jgi:hypothetical protein
MLSRALLLLLVAAMVTMPSVASSCALHCDTDHIGMLGTAPQADAPGADCHHKAPDGGHPPDGETSPELGMTSLCAFAAAGTISISVATVLQYGSAAPSSYFPKRIVSQIPHPPDKPPRV